MKLQSNSAEISLRLANPSDIKLIMDMESKGFDPGVRETEDTYLERIRVFPQGAVIMESNGTPVGCIFSEIWERETSLSAEDFKLDHSISLSHDPNGDWLYICSMTVVPEFRGMGFGHSLFNGHIEALKHEFNRLSKIVLLVNETWSHARKIYEKSGFAKTMVLPGFFRPFDGIVQDGIVMTREISG